MTSQSRLRLSFSPFPFHSLLLTLVTVLAWGCIHSGPALWLTVANRTDTPISSIAIENENGPLYHLERLAAQEIGPYRRCAMRSKPPWTLNWTDAAGQSHRLALTPDKPIPMDFRGRLVFQIDAEGDTARWLVVPDPDRLPGDLPWTRPEKWEGTLPIPGLSRE